MLARREQEVGDEHDIVVECIEPGDAGAFGLVKHVAGASTTTGSPSTW